MGKFLLSLMCLIILSFSTKAEEISFAEGLPTDWQKAGTTASVTRVNKKCLQLQKGASITSPVYNNVSEINVELNISNKATTLTIEQSLDNVNWTTLKTIAKAECSVEEWRQFKIPTQGDTSNGVSFRLKATASSYYISLFDYTIITTGPIEPVFKGIPQKEDGSLGYEITIGETQSLPTIEPSELTYSFSTTNNDIIDIDEITKTITAKKIGTAIVNFTTEAFEDKYLAGNGSFEISVVGKEPKLSFANESVYGKVNTGVVWQQVTVTEPEENLGAITYSSSDPEIVTVDASTGQIKPSDVKKAGVATITATIAANGDYAEGSCSYMIVVIDPNAEVKPGETLFDFTTTNPYGMTTMSGNTTSYERDMDNPVTSIAGVNETVIISFDGRYRSWKTSNSNELRVEKSNTTDPASSLTVKVPEGYKITKIGITGSAVTPKYSPESGDSPDDDFNSVWIPTVIDGSSQVVDEVTITADPNQLKISKINVMWDASGSDMKPAQLTFAPNVNGIYVNEEAEINAVNNPEGRTITYSIAGLNADQYTITPSEDGKTMKVRVNTPGTYTLEARSAAGDGFRDGFAIMRLNVYRHLAVYVADVKIEQDEINTETETYIRIDVPENAFLYYKFENSSTPETTADDITDENLLPGYTLYDNGDDIPIPAKTIGYFNFYIANYGYKSPIRKIALSFETGVTDIDVNTEDGVVRLFDLNGRQINGEPEKGVYIRIQNGKASKVLVK